LRIALVERAIFHQIMMRNNQKDNFPMVTKNLHALKHKYPAKPNVIIQSIITSASIE
jgi:hypothetical protein